jgi:hypothetical protein
MAIANLLNMSGKRMVLLLSRSKNGILAFDAATFIAQDGERYSDCSTF